MGCTKQREVWMNYVPVVTWDTKPEHWWPSVCIVMSITFETWACTSVTSSVFLASLNTTITCIGYMPTAALKEWVEDLPQSLHTNNSSELKTDSPGYCKILCR